MENIDCKGGVWLCFSLCGLVAEWKLSNRIVPTQGFHKRYLSQGLLFWSSIILKAQNFQVIRLLKLINMLFYLKEFENL
jgi:hypothetical protein